MKHTISQIYIYDKNKNGEPYTTKDGKKFKRVVIKVEPSNPPKEYDNQYISTAVFSNQSPILNWKPGDEVDIKIYKDGEYWNFDIPSKTDLLIEKINKLEKRVQHLEDFIINNG